MHYARICTVTSLLLPRSLGAFYCFNPTFYLTDSFSQISFLFYVETLTDRDFDIFVLFGTEGMPVAARYYTHLPRHYYHGSSVCASHPHRISVINQGQTFPFSAWGSPPMGHDTLCPLPAFISTLFL